jgi:thymidylate synthase (FAD)
MAQEFYIPTQWRSSDEQYKGLDEKERAKTDAESRALYEHALAESSQIYEKLLAKGVARELARGVLPVSLYTQFVFSCNVRSLFHFVGLRADSHAQWEIQQYAKGMIRLARKQFPISVGLWCKTHNVTWLDEKP